MIQTTTIIAEINKFMQQNNLKLTQLARRSEINTGTISAVISGARPLAVDQMDRITEAMGLPKGHFYKTYIRDYLQEMNPDWRRVRPFMHNCAELDKLDYIREVVALLLDNLLYSPLLFDLAEELFELGKHEAATILYENVAMSERNQHSERLALCQYRLFKIRLGNNQSLNMRLAHQFEPYIERLDEIDQLDALKDLANIYRALYNWDKLEELAVILECKGKIQYKLAHQIKKRETSKKQGRPLFFYCAYANLLRACVCEARKDYKEALHYTNIYSDLRWVEERDNDTLHWLELFKEWARVNTYAYTLLSGDASVIPKYIDYMETNKDEVLPGLFNIIEAANRFDLGIDDILERFDSYIVDYLKDQHTLGLYTDQLIATAFADFLHELAVYYFNRSLYPVGFKYLLHCLELSAKINKRSCIIKSVGLFERFRVVASPETKSTYQNLINEVYEDEKDKAASILGN